MTASVSHTQAAVCSNDRLGASTLAKSSGRQDPRARASLCRAAVTVAHKEGLGTLRGINSASSPQVNRDAHPTLSRSSIKAAGPTEFKRPPQLAAARRCRCGGNLKGLRVGQSESLAASSRRAAGGSAAARVESAWPESRRPGPGPDPPAEPPVLQARERSARLDRLGRPRHGSRRTHLKRAGEPLPDESPSRGQRARESRFSPNGGKRPRARCTA